MAPRDGIELDANPAIPGARQHQLGERNVLPDHAHRLEYGDAALGRARRLRGLKQFTDLAHDAFVRECSRLQCNAEIASPLDTACAVIDEHGCALHQIVVGFAGGAAGWLRPE